MKILENFLRLEAASGLLLIFAAILALIFNNSPWHQHYEAFIEFPIHIRLGTLWLDKPLWLWVNDGLMAIFFLVAGLELKREMLMGHLQHLEKALLPVMGAIGGVLIPALIYQTFNHADPIASKGWAIPAATDIAFALGILALLGNVPQSLKLSLLSIAIIDDVIAVLIIAICYTKGLDPAWLSYALLPLAGLLILNWRNNPHLSIYLSLGILLWICLLKSGIHATLTGVVLAFFIPLERDKKQHQTTLVQLEHKLHNWVAYLILPLFAFVNAGVSLKGLSLEMFMQDMPKGIALGLFLGKPLGVMVFSCLAVFLFKAKLPEDTTWSSYFGMACLTGIGFTMSLFIGILALPVDIQTLMRLGVLIGSTSSAILGYVVLHCALKR